MKSVIEKTNSDYVDFHDSQGDSYRIHTQRFRSSDGECYIQVSMQDVGKLTFSSRRFGYDYEAAARVFIEALDKITDDACLIPEGDAANDMF